MKEAPWKEAVVYQIYPRSFMDSNGDGIGDLRGIISRLDYIQTLGVDVIWLSPVYQSPNDDNGYDISDYRRIMADFGTMEDFDCLLDGLHSRGIKLMMDLVVNHTSDEHAWFRAALSDKTSPYRSYYFFRDGIDGNPPNNWASHFGFSAWEKEPNGEQYYLHLYTKKQPDLNWDNPAVREEVYDLMRYWVDKGVDGFRMDVISYISKVPGLPPMPGKGLQLPTPYISNGPHVHEYLREMNERILAPNHLMTVGEMVSVTAEEARLYTNEDRHELQMVFTFEHMFLDAMNDDKWQWKPWTLSDLKAVFTHWQLTLEDGCWNSLYLNNHDQPRMVSRFGDDGKYRVRSAKMLATFLHTLQGTPYIYQGEELGMTNIALDTIDKYRDVETLNHYKEAVELNHENEADVMRVIRMKSRDNARTPMQWDDSENAGFTTGTPWLKVNPNHVQINAKQALDDPNSVFYYYQRLIALRKQHPVMVYGKYQIICPEHPQVYAYTRTYHGDHLLVLLNFSAEETTIALPDDVSPKQATPFIGNMDMVHLRREQPLAPYEAQVWQWRDE